MQIALGATLLLLAVWLVALRPKSTGGEEAVAPTPAQSTPAPIDGAAPGTAGLARAVQKAQDTVDRANGSTTASGGASAPTAGAPAQGGAPAAANTRATRADRAHLREVKAAVRHHKAVAIAFVDPNTADARAVAREVAHVSSFHGRALALSAPLARLSDYAFITNNVEVTVAPTVVIVDLHRKATTIVGFADRGEIQQRLADALAAKRKR
jgi:hypothetical protein